VPSSPSKPVSRTTLPNGLRVVVAEDHAVPVAAIGLWVDAGACDEPADRRGIAHFLEHMMFRGSEHVGPEEHAQQIARHGGDCNAATAPDFTVYHETVPAEAVEEALRLEADRFLRLTPTAEHTDIERRVILEELHVYENQPAVRALLAIQKAVAGGHPYALPALGRREDIEALSAGDLAAFHHRCYRPDRTALVVCGDVTQAQVEDMAHRHFGGWTADGDGGEPSRPPFETRVGELSLRLSLEVPIVAQVHRAPPLGEVDKPAVDLLVALLSWGQSSPLQETLVRRRRLCVAAGAMPMLLACGGAVVLFGAFLPPGRHRVRREVMRELADGLAARGPDPERFEQHLKRFRKRRASEHYSPDARMRGLGHAELLEGGFERYERGLDELAEVTPERVREAAARLFAPENTLELDVTPERVRWWMVPVGLFLRIWPR